MYSSTRTARRKLSGYRAGRAASDGELPDHRHVPRLEHRHQIVQDLIRHRLVKNPLVSIRKIIELEALHLHAQFVGHVTNGDRREIRLAGDGTEAGEFGEDEFDGVIAVFAWIGEGFEDRAGIGELLIGEDRKSTRLNSSHDQISYAVFC